MQIIDVGDWEQGSFGKHLALFKVLAVMLCPMNVERREEFFFAIITQYIAYLEETIDCLLDRSMSELVANVGK